MFLLAESRSRKEEEEEGADGPGAGGLASGAAGLGAGGASSSRRRRYVNCMDYHCLYLIGYVFYCSLAHISRSIPAYR